MAHTVTGFSLPEIKNLKLQVLISFLPNIYFHLGRQALEVLLYEEKGTVLTCYSVNIVHISCNIIITLFVFTYVHIFIHMIPFSIKITLYLYIYTG